MVNLVFVCLSTKIPSCWINFGSWSAMGTAAPVLGLVVSTIIITESTGMHMTNIPSYSKTQIAMAK